MPIVKYIIQNEQKEGLVLHAYYYTYKKKVGCSPTAVPYASSVTTIAVSSSKSFFRTTLRGSCCPTSASSTNSASLIDCSLAKYSTPGGTEPSWSHSTRPATSSESKRTVLCLGPPLPRIEEKLNHLAIST